MVFGTPISALLYMDGANKAKRDGKKPTYIIKKLIPMKSKKEKRPFNFHDEASARNVAIVASIIAGIIILLSLTLVLVITDVKIKDAEKNAKYLPSDGSVNKRYTAYLIEDTALDSKNRETNYYFIFQFVGGKVRCYRTSTGNRDKASILNYFDNVREEKPSPALVLGAWFYLDVFLCVLAAAATAGLWGWWYYLTKHGPTKATTDVQQDTLLDELAENEADDTDKDNIEDDDELAKIGRPVVAWEAMKFTIPLPGRQDLPKLPQTCQMQAPHESTESFCQRLNLKLIKGEGFGYSAEDPIGYYAVPGITRADEYFRSIVPAVGEGWRLMAYYRIGSFDKGVDKYVVMYTTEIEGETVGYAYELYLWMYDQDGFPNNLMGIYRVPHGFIPNPNECTWANKTLYNKKHNLYGTNEQVEEEPKMTLEESLRAQGRIGTVLLCELVAHPEQKNDILRGIPEAEGLYEVTVKKEDMPKIKFAEHKTVNGKPFCPVTGDKKVYLKNPAELQAIFESNASDVLYVGKADNLKRRITQLVDMAFGGTAHRGGIDLWAVQDYEKYLQIKWGRLGDIYSSAAEVERNILVGFKEKHNGNLPVANRK